MNTRLFSLVASVLALVACGPGLDNNPIVLDDPPPTPEPDPGSPIGVVAPMDEPKLPNTTIKAVDSTMDRPDGKGKFDLSNGIPAIDGKYMMFTTTTNGDRDAIWSVDLQTKAIVKLAGLDTPVPDGEGNFVRFNDGYSAHGLAPISRGGRVLFFGTDSGTVGYRGGLYSVPVGGGAITKVANKSTVLPGYGPMDAVTHSDWSFSIQGEKVVFLGTYAGHGGLYSTTFDGQNVTRILDDQSPLKGVLYQYFQPVLHGSSVTFITSGVFDPVSGPNSIFTCPITGGSAGCVEVVNESTALPNNTHTPPHARLWDVHVDGDTVAFQADDSNDTTDEFHGIYRAGASGLDTFFTTKDTSLPGMFETLVATRTLTVATDSGTTALVAYQRVGKAAAYYKAGADGVKHRILGVDDQIDSQTILGVGLLGPTSTNKGRVAMIFGNYDWAGIYASP